MRNQTQFLIAGIAVAAMLFVVVPAQVAHAQLSIDPPLGCASPSDGDCASGGCDACEGSTCGFVSGIEVFTLSASIEEGLSCDGTMNDECVDTGCDDPDTLRAKGSVTMTQLQGGTPWSHDVIVCEASFLCSNPTEACVRCTDKTLTDTAPTFTTLDLECDDIEHDSGQWQYQIWAVVLDGSACPSGCDSTTENACDPDSDCNACSNKGFAHAASCCLTL